MPRPALDCRGHRLKGRLAGTIGSRNYCPNPRRPAGTSLRGRRKDFALAPGRRQLPDDPGGLQLVDKIIDGGCRSRNPLVLFVGEYPLGKSPLGESLTLSFVTGGVLGDEEPVQRPLLAEAPTHPVGCRRRSRQRSPAWRVPGSRIYAGAGIALPLSASRVEVLAQDGALAGRVRLSVPTTYGHYRLPPVLARFAQQYPQVQVELNITNRNVDLVAEGFDLAIRLGQLPDSGLVARKLEDALLLLVAAPDYLQRRGTPQTLDELQQHLCLPFVMPRTGRLAPWVFRDGGRDVDWLPRSSIETSDDVLGVVSLAEQGIGICQSYEFIVRERLQRGQLVEVLPQLRGRSRPFSVIYAPHRRQSAAARAMIELLVGNAAVVGDGAD